MNIKEIKNKYHNQNIYEAYFLFHGSNKNLEVIKPHQATCATTIPINLRNAIYATSVLEMAMCYAILRNIKTQKYYDAKTNKMVDNYAFKISFYKNQLKVVIEKGELPKDSKGYVYVFKNDSFIKELYDSVQYISKSPQKPIEKIKVTYKDVEKFISYENEYNEDLTQSL